MSRTALGAAIAVLAVAAPSLARADDDDSSSNSVTWAIPGYLYGYVGGKVPARGHGVELSILHIPNVQLYRGFGVVGQLQSYDGTHARSALAAEAVWAMFGFELGWAWRQSDGVHPTQHGLHVSPFVSLGIVSLGFR